jgi:hypothetical protein
MKLWLQWHTFAPHPNRPAPQEKKETSAAHRAQTPPWRDRRCRRGGSRSTRGGRTRCPIEGGVRVWRGG